MGALTIAFDTTIVGALALPWVLLVIHLFFCEGENRLPDLLKWVQAQQQPAVAGVLLFAMTYTLGSAVSRIAFDCFNDDDLHFQIGRQLLRVPVTENRIIASVYCEADACDRNLLPPDKGDSLIAQRSKQFRMMEEFTDSCRRNLTWAEWRRYDRSDDDLIGAARDLFGLQENQLLLKGDDYTLRLRQLHDQIMVLRGAAFSGVVTLSLCLFALGAKFRSAKTSWLRLAFVPLPVLYLVAASIAIFYHYQDPPVTDPPYMEFALFLLGFAGGSLVWRRPPQPPPEPEKLTNGGDAGKKDWRKGKWGLWTSLSALLMITATLGWWSTEVFYTQQVIYSFGSQAPQKLGGAGN